MFVLQTDAIRLSRFVNSRSAVFSPSSCLPPRPDDPCRGSGSASRNGNHNLRQRDNAILGDAMFARTSCLHCMLTLTSWEGDHRSCMCRPQPGGSFRLVRGLDILLMEAVCLLQSLCWAGSIAHHCLSCARLQGVRGVTGVDVSRRSEMHQGLALLDLSETTVRKMLIWLEADTKPASPGSAEQPLINQIRLHGDSVPTFAMYADNKRANDVAGARVAKCSPPYCN